MLKLKLNFLFFLSATTIYAQNAENIVETHIKNTGGEIGWNNLNSIILKGDAVINLGTSYPIVIYHQRPYNKKVAFLINGKEILNEGYDGKMGWTYNEATKKNIVVPDYKPDSFDSDLLKYNQKGFKLTYIGIEEYSQDNKCYKVELRKNTNSTIYCFDKDSYEIVMEKNESETLYFSNFKRFNGLSFATKIVGKPKDGGEYIIKFNEVKTNPAIDKKNFKFQ